jgi:predicted nucleic acid-binding protein
MMEGPYTVVPNKDNRGYDVVRMAPTVVSTELSMGEAEALAFALNTQIRLIEGKLK